MQSSGKIECLVLGAGQEVGKSCVVVTMGGKRIMFDCGMHMGHQDDKQFPDFSQISKTNEFDKELTCIIITHFHLDHIGALAYFTEVCGYKGPIYMTYPTRALAPLALNDFHQEKFTLDHITKCMNKVIVVDLNQTVQVDKDLQIRAYYAGHVIGAAMFYAKVGDTAIVYTGDYNMTSERLLGAAEIDTLQIDLVITESTYGKTTRGLKFCNENKFLRAIHECVTGGGKVLIPTSALGRAHELLILLEGYWERNNLTVPIYLSSGLTIQATEYYKMFIDWTSKRIKVKCSTRNVFDFKHVGKFDKSLIHAPGPCILFATPGMLSGGFSLEVFSSWATSKENLIVLPGFCMAGTVGRELLAGHPKVSVDKDTKIDVKCKTHPLSFSPHTDAKGIIDLLKFLSPKNVILVHGDKLTMTELKERIKTELQIDCYDPANNTTVHISAEYPPNPKKIDVTDRFIESGSSQDFTCLKNCGTDSSSLDFQKLQQMKEGRFAEGVLVMDKIKRAKLVHQNELCQLLGVTEHTVKFSLCCAVKCTGLIEQHKQIINEETVNPASDQHSWLHLLHKKLSNELGSEIIVEYPGHLQRKSFKISFCFKDKCDYRIKNCPQGIACIFFCCSWYSVDAKLAWEVVRIMENLDTLSKTIDVQDREVNKNIIDLV